MALICKRLYMKPGIHSRIERVRLLQRKCPSKTADKDALKGNSSAACLGRWRGSAKDCFPFPEACALPYGRQAH